MYSGEWALILFSILTQCSVGIWLVGIGLRTFVRRDGDSASVAQIIWRPFLVVGPLMCIALVISIFHLGSPMQAYASVANLLTSWLSREIVFSGLFLFFWVISIVFYRRENAGIALGWVTALLGLIAVFSMSSIYYMTPIPAWASVNTYISFYATMFILGGIACAFFAETVSGSKSHYEFKNSFWKLSLSIMVVIVIQLAFFLNSLDGYEIRSVVYCVLLFLGGISYVAYNYQRLKKPSQSSRALFYLSLVLIFSAEILGRYLFYASAAPVIG